MHTGMLTGSTAVKAAKEKQRLYGSKKSQQKSFHQVAPLPICLHILILQRKSLLTFICLNIF